MDRKALYNRHRGLATVLAKRLERYVRPPWSSEDMHQAAELALWIASHEWPGRGDFKRYAARQVLRSVRAFTRQKPLVDLADIAADPVNPEVEVRQELLRLTIEVGNLPDKQREAVVARHDDELPVAKVAERLDLSISGTKWLLRKAYRHLRRRLS